ncbi:MAG: hypothetical protein P8179_18635 [Candidatus Thiodiazotropha sp.]|jgi:hypothetical protein
MINKSAIHHITLAAHRKQSQAHTNKSNNNHSVVQKSHNKLSKGKLKEAPSTSEKIFSRPTKLEIFIKQRTAIESKSIQKAIKPKKIMRREDSQGS